MMTTPTRLSLVAAAALLAGCGGSQLPIGAMAQSQTVATHAAKSGDLLYAGGVIGGHSAVLMLTYPRGKEVGKLTQDIGQYLCSDPATGNVFITSDSKIFEYAHGGTQPIATLTAPSSGDDFAGCAVDPMTGNLAVAADNLNHQPVAVFVYAGGQGTPTVYYDSNAFYFTYCGYDNEGNLFIDGVTNSDTLLFDELPSGGSTLEAITVNSSTSDGPVQWDGTYITVENPRPPIIYRIQISGSTGTVVGTTKLRNQKKTKRRPTSLTWIQGETVITATGDGNKRIGYWRYPDGGKPVRILNNLVTGKKDGFGVFTVSVAPSR